MKHVEVLNITHVCCEVGIYLNFCNINLSKVDFIAVFQNRCKYGNFRDFFFLDKKSEIALEFFILR